MAEEEVLIEVDAVQAIYGDDCLVLETYPPHLHLHIRPRTADDSSQQFVEAVLGIRAHTQYPQEPPDILLVDSKGLDDQRQKHLVNGIQDKGRELSSCLMLVILCEEAVEKLTSMNHPDGDCPLCLYPLVEDQAGDNILPFMKLLSCFHCFHRECIIRWWNWLQDHKEGEPTHSSRASVDLLQQVKGSTGSCPVCRKVFHAKDIEHVLDLVGAYSQSGSSAAIEDENLLQSDSERIRRKKFEDILKVQQENSGLIEPKRNQVLVPGIFLPQSTAQPTAVSGEGTTKQQHTARTDHLATNSSGGSNRASTNERRNLDSRKRGGGNPRKQVKLWIKKENSNAS